MEGKHDRFIWKEAADCQRFCRQLHAFKDGRGRAGRVLYDQRGRDQDGEERIRAYLTASPGRYTAKL